MLKIRLQRVGRRNNPAFRVVATESTRGPKSGDNLEILGSYNPHTKISSINADRVHHWVKNGAQVSPTVHNILIKGKITEGKTINVLPRKSPVVKEEKSEGEGSVEETKEEKTEESESSDEVKTGTAEESAPEEVKAEEEVKEKIATEEKDLPAQAEEKVEKKEE